MAAVWRGVVTVSQQAESSFVFGVISRGFANRMILTM